MATTLPRSGRREPLALDPSQPVASDAASRAAVSRMAETCGVDSNLDQGAAIVPAITVAVDVMAHQAR